MSDDQEDQDVTRWTVHGRRAMYESEWVNVYLDDVELPDGHHIDHHVLTFPKTSQTAVVLNDARDHVLLIWRHRFITDAWGWEVPAGWVEPGEDPEAAIRREIEEETGYAAGHIEPMVSYNALSGISTMRFTAYVGWEARQSLGSTALKLRIFMWLWVDLT
jgi:8-oxo-dGTP pyrophosphatase MutT (NUDIX family)